MTTENDMQKKCGFCGESIPAKAGRCPYCGSILEVTFDSTYNFNQPVDSSSVNQPVDSSYNGYQPEEVKPRNGETAGQDTEQHENAKPADSVPPESGQGQQPVNTPQKQNAYRTYGSNGYAPNYNYGGVREPLSNGLKVFLTVLFTVVPGIGQLAGIIAAIVFMNSEGDSDRKSFGVALLVASLIMFVISCIGCFVFAIAFSNQFNQFNY